MSSGYRPDRVYGRAWGYWYAMSFEDWAVYIQDCFLSSKFIPPPCRFYTPDLDFDPEKCRQKTVPFRWHILRREFLQEVKGAYVWVLNLDPLLDDPWFFWSELQIVAGVFRCEIEDRIRVLEIDTSLSGNGRLCLDRESPDGRKTTEEKETGAEMGQEGGALLGLCEHSVAVLQAKSRKKGPEIG